MWINEEEDKIVGNVRNTLRELIVVGNERNFVNESEIFALIRLLIPWQSFNYLAFRESIVKSDCD